MGGLSVAELRHGTRRFVAPAIAILLGVAFLTATLALSSTMQRSLEISAAAEVEGHAVVASGGSLGPSTVDEIRSLPGVSKVDVEQTEMVQARGQGSRQAVTATTVVPDRLEPISGRKTARSGEVVLDREAASSLGARPGSTVTVGGSPGTPERRTVAGIVRITGAGGMPTIVADSSDIGRWSGKHSYEALLVASEKSPDRLAADLRKQLGGDVTVRTADQETDHRVSEMVTGVQFITTFFGLFAVIALFVAGLVISNTFQILLAQRARALALMRCVGASRRQVRRAVIGESLGLGLVASGLGVAAGLGVVAALVRVSDSMELTMLPLEQLGVSPLAVGLPLLLGTGVTVLSALRPARRASRVAPLAALRPEEAPEAASRASRMRVLAGAALTVLGLAGTFLGAVSGEAATAVLAGIVSFVGVILTAPVVVPALARLLGSGAARVAGVPGELATDNTVRNPRRSAATSTALLIGITLMSAMLVGASTSKASIDEAVDKQFALDVTVSTDKKPIPATVRQELASTDGVESSAVLRTTTADVVGPKESRSQQIVGVPDSAHEVLRDGSAVAGVGPGRLVLDEQTATDLGVSEGKRLRVHGVPLTVHLSEGDTGGMMVTESDLQRIAPDAQPSTMWLRLTPDADPGAVIGDVRKAASTIGADVQGAAGARAELDTMVRVMLIIVTALLGVAVLIALVGVANTLGLSVLERRRETALLRALGFTAGQVRRTLAIEALLVALVAAVVGTVLGVVYGWAGSRALLGTYAEGVAPQIPVGLLLALVLAAAGCGLLASWAPARTASRTAPVAALASE